MLFITKVQMFRAIAQCEGLSAEQIEFLNKEADMIEQRNAHRKATPTKAQRANVELVERIKSILADSENGMTTTEISKALGGEYTPQKISALLHRADGINITKEKKVTYFSVD